MIAFSRYSFGASLMALALLLSGCATSDANRLESEKKVRFEDTPKGLAIKINDGILFKFGEDKYMADAESVLDELMSVIRQARGKILTEGHTDTVGSEVANRKLSQSRAERVKKSLVDRKVIPSRIVAVGYGSSRLEVNPEVTPEDARRNRRAVIILEGETRQSIGADVAENRMNNLLDDLVGRASLVGDSLKGAGASIVKSIGDTIGGGK